MAEKIIRDGYAEHKTRVVKSDTEREELLFIKLDEELAEVKEAYASGDRDALREELGDLVEVAFAIGGYVDVEAQRTKKKRAKGGFQRGFVMEV